jgi:hypothetical protein
VRKGEGEGGGGREGGREREGRREEDRREKRWRGGEGACGNLERVNT